MAKLGSISFLAGVLALAVVVIAAIGILNGYTSGNTITSNEEKAAPTESTVTEATVGETKILSEKFATVKDSSTGKLSEVRLVEKDTKKAAREPREPIKKLPGEPTRPGMKSPVGWCIRNAVQNCVGGGEKQQPPEEAKPPKKERAEVVKADLIATEESDDEIIDYELVFTEVPPEEEDYYAYAMDSYKVIDMYSVGDCVRDAVFGCLGEKGPEKAPEKAPAEAPARPAAQKS